MKPGILASLIGLTVIASISCAAADCNPNQLAIFHNGKVLVSNGADFFRFGSQLQLEMKFPYQRTSEFDNGLLKYPYFTVDNNSGAVYVAHHFRIPARKQAKATSISPPKPRFPRLIDAFAVGSGNQIFIVRIFPNPPSVVVGKLDSSGTFRSQITAPLADAPAPIAAIAADATGGYCVAFNKTLDMRATPPTYEEHVDCYHRARGTYARYVSIDPKIFGEHSITGLAIRSNGDLYITALPNMLYRLHAYGQSRPTVRSATLSDTTQYGTERKVVLDDQTVIVDNNETRSIVGYSVANMNRPLWTITGVGWPYSGPWGMAVADGMLYVGEKPDRDESMPAGKAAHGVVRYMLRGSARPVWSGHISGEDFGFIPQDIAISKNDTLLVGDVGGGDVTVIASAAHNPRLSPRGDSTRTLLGEDLIAFSGTSRLFTSGLDGSIHEYPQNSSMESAPLRTIDGRIQSGSPFVGMAASNDGVVFRSDPTHQSIVVSSAGSSKLRPHVETITGPATQLKNPQGLALDDSGNLYVANEDGDDILVFAARSRGNVPPYKVLGGRFSGMSHPTSLAIAPDKTILVVGDVSTVGLSLSPTSELLRISPSNVRIGSASFPSACHFESL